MSPSQGDFKHFAMLIYLKIFCYQCEQHLNITMSEDKVDSGLSGRGKVFGESKMGIKDWLLLPHFSHLQCNLIETS